MRPVADATDQLGAHVAGRWGLLARQRRAEPAGVAGQLVEALAKSAGAGGGPTGSNDALSVTGATIPIAAGYTARA